MGNALPNLPPGYRFDVAAVVTGTSVGASLPIEPYINSWARWKRPTPMCCVILGQL
jgi:hypothetical protein